MASTDPPWQNWDSPCPQQQQPGWMSNVKIAIIVVGSITILLGLACCLNCWYRHRDKTEEEDDGFPKDGEELERQPMNNEDQHYEAQSPRPGTRLPTSPALAQLIARSGNPEPERTPQACRPRRNTMVFSPHHGRQITRAMTIQQGHLRRLHSMDDMEQQPLRKQHRRNPSMSQWEITTTTPDAPP